MNETILDMLRHGEPVGGRAFRGHGVDDPLSEKGWQQMWQAISEPVSWDHIISSPMLRCREFAEAMAKKYNIPISIEQNLKEVGFGVWEGRRQSELEAENPEAFYGFYQDPVNRRPEGAEPLTEFVSRIAGVYEDALQRYAGKQILWVAHAGVIRAAITYIMGAEPSAMYRLSISNAAIARIRAGRYGAKLESLVSLNI